MSGLLVVLEADPDRRRRFAREMEATLAPVLNGGLCPLRTEVPASRAGMTTHYMFYLNFCHSRP